MKEIFVATCAYCEREKDCRPFGPQGSMICAACAKEHWREVKPMLREFMRFRGSPLVRRVLQEIRTKELAPK
jgi:hypothetical protein